MENQNLGEINGDVEIMFSRTFKHTGCQNRNNLFWGIMVRVRFWVMVSVRVNSLRDSFSVLLYPQHHSMLTTAGRVHTS